MKLRHFLDVRKLKQVLYSGEEHNELSTIRILASRFAWTENRTLMMWLRKGKQSCESETWKIS